MKSKITLKKIELLCKDFKKLDVETEYVNNLKSEIWYYSLNLVEIFRRLINDIPLIIVTEENSINNINNNNEILFYNLPANFKQDRYSAGILLLPQTKIDSINLNGWIIKSFDSFYNLIKNIDIDSFRKLIFENFGIERLNPYQTTKYSEHTMFFGRKVEIESIINRDINHVIVGPRRIGKTSLAKYALRMLKKQPEMQLYTKQRYFYRTCFVDVRELTETKNLWHLILNELGFESSDMVRGRIRRVGFPKRIKEMSEYEIFSNLTEHKYKNSTIILDEVDRFIKKDEENDWEILTKLVSLVDKTNLRLVLCGYDRLFAAAISSIFPLSGRMKLIKLSELSKEDAEGLICDPLHELGVLITNKQDIVDIIYDISSGLPNRIQKICSEIVEDSNKWNDLHIDRLYMEKLENKRSFSEEFFRRDFDGIREPLSRLVMFLLSSKDLYKRQDLLNDIRLGLGINIDEIQLNQQLDYLYLCNIIEDLPKNDIIRFRSNYFRSRLLRSLKEPSGETILNSLVTSTIENFGRIEAYDSINTKILSRLFPTKLFFLKDLSTPERLKEKYTGPSGVILFILAIINLLPYLIGLKIPAMKLNLSVASSVYTLYHLLKFYTLLNVNQLKAVLFDFSRSRKRWFLCSITDRISHYLGWVVIVFIGFTIIAKINVSFIGYHSIVFPSLIYEILGIPAP